MGFSTDNSRLPRIPPLGGGRTEESIVLISKELKELKELKEEVSELKKEVFELKDVIYENRRILSKI